MQGPEHVLFVRLSVLPNVPGGQSAGGEFGAQNLPAEHKLLHVRLSTRLFPASATKAVDALASAAIAGVDDG